MFTPDEIQNFTMGNALLVAAAGLVVVFVMLAALAVIILLISKVVAFIDGEKAPAVAAPKAAAPVAAASAQPAQDQDELVAVLIAAIAAESDTSPDSFRITNIQS